MLVFRWGSGLVLGHKMLETLIGAQDQIHLRIQGPWDTRSLGRLVLRYLRLGPRP